MKKEQIIETIKLMPTYPPQIGYFFRATQHGLGLVEEAKKIAKEVWKQKFLWVKTYQLDMYDIQHMLIEHSKEMEPTTFIFDEMEKLTNEMRNFIFHRFSTNRKEYLHTSCHVIYLVNPDDNEYYQNTWDDYVMLHTMEFNVEA